MAGQHSVQEPRSAVLVDALLGSCTEYFNKDSQEANARASLNARVSSQGSSRQVLLVCTWTQVDDRHWGSQWAGHWRWHRAGHWCLHRAGRRDWRVRWAGHWSVCRAVHGRVAWAGHNCRTWIRHGQCVRIIQGWQADRKGQQGLAGTLRVNA